MSQDLFALALLDRKCSDLLSSVFFSATLDPSKLNFALDPALPSHSNLNKSLISNEPDAYPVAYPDLFANVDPDSQSVSRTMNETTDRIE